MDWIKKNFDPNGYSIWKLDYDKLPTECKVDYKTKNMCSRFLDMNEAFRKDVFCVHTVLGEEGNYNIRGVWLMRGTEKLPNLDQNSSTEYYNFRKLDIND